MLQIYHVQEALRSLWVFWGATHPQLHSFGSSCRALGPAKAISAGSGQSPGWEMILGSFLTSISGFFGTFQDQRLLVVLSLNAQCEQRMNIRFAPGEHLVPSLEAPWKRCFEQKCWPHSTLIFTIYTLGWAIFSIFCLLNPITRHDGRTEGVFCSCLLYLAQNSVFLICICFLLLFLPYEGNNELHKWAAEYEHIYFVNYFSDYWYSTEREVGGTVWHYFG